MSTLIEPTPVWIGGERWQCFALEFPTEPILLEVYGRAVTEVRGHHDQRLQIARRDLVMYVVDATDDAHYIEGVDWWPGEPQRVDTDTALALTLRANMIERGEL